MDIGIELPATAACADAERVVRRYCPPWLLNHAVRSYVWAAEIGRLEAVGFDPELLYVAALLHDIGLVQDFDNHTEPFETAGGHVAWVFAAGAGWPDDRATRAAEVIERHMWAAVDPALDPEGHLLEVGTGIDISGRRTEAITPALRDEALRRWPRLDLGEEFSRCFRQQSQRKPTSRAAALVTGVEQSLRSHPFERDGVARPATARPSERS